ncbi:DUF2798 domain-containing protein [Aliivibrio sifiae]|uniref:MFS transporter permease n=1 Tax=Aliivibrio sifiae TaxID=566293 RepID=A0A2S7XJ52_9GAMM|nr:DUF2798 domain-containing protein [Aliivibrio sifiae]PQJ93686.1 hypothetical protein BTO23_06240 [Aliivibrio sifiae]GLR74207.1 hypothetical protein GCM10007855_10810 [Aliivibrio sifiae]
MNKKQFWLSALLSSITMALLMSGSMSAIRMGGVSLEWVSAWMEGFTIAWPVAIVANLTILPKIRQFTTWLCRDKKTQPVTAS